MSVNKLNGRFYGGDNAAIVDVQLSVNQAGMAEIDCDPPLRLPFCDLKVTSRLGNSARYIHCPDGRIFETADNDGVDALCHDWGAGGADTFLHRLESRRRIIFTALLVLIVTGFVFVRYGIPALSYQITRLVPTEVDALIGEQYIDYLDEAMFEPSQLDPTVREAMEADFQAVLREDAHAYRLLFRDGGVIGANAFALPDGTVIVTDQLVELVKDPELLRGILLHEIGHVHHRHTMQSLVRQSGVATVVLLMTGDVSTASSVVLLLPAVLLQSQYSREFETQADSYALEHMKSQGINPEDFALVMEKLMGFDVEEEAEREMAEDEEAFPAWLNYFSTHPATKERIERFRTQATNSSPKD